MGQRAKTSTGQGSLPRIDILCGYYLAQGKRRLSSIYFGGGISLLTPEEFAEILAHIDAAFKITTRTEISMECNPASADVKKAENFKKNGLNRLSIGVQSFDREVLRTLGRVHSPEEAVASVEKARKSRHPQYQHRSHVWHSGAELYDLDSFRRKSDQPESQTSFFYSLEFMENTRFDLARREGRLQETEAETDRLMYESALRLLAEAGLRQYEISMSRWRGTSQA